MAKITVDFEKCKGCTLCVTVCPKKIVEMTKNRNRRGFFTAACIDDNACTGCALCAVMCPDCAIMVEK